MMLFPISVLLVLVVYVHPAVVDATSLSNDFNRKEMSHLTLAARNEIEPGKSSLSADVLIKLGQLEEKIDKLYERKDACENGWIKYGNSCYYFSLTTEKLAWPDALLQCRAKGGYLAEIRNQTENNFVREQAQFLGSAGTGTSVRGDCNHHFLTGMNQIPDSALSSSSSLSSSFYPKYGRLYQVTSSSKYGAWIPATYDQRQWIQADLQKPVEVTTVITQGRYDGENWVKKFKVFYSLDCSYWKVVTSKGGSEQIFTGNYDRNTPVTHKFEGPVRAKCIRINPLEWNGAPALRFDVIGCNEERRQPTDLGDFSLWLGAADILHEHEFKWVTSGTRISYETFRDWHPRQPDNARDSEHCLLMKPLTGWHDAECSIETRFVCEKNLK